jgi:hypothetical protein
MNDENAFPFARVANRFAESGKKKKKDPWLKRIYLGFAGHAVHLKTALELVLAA